MLPLNTVFETRACICVCLLPMFAERILTAFPFSTLVFRARSLPLSLSLLVCVFLSLALLLCVYIFGLFISLTVIATTTTRPQSHVKLILNKTICVCAHSVLQQHHRWKRQTDVAIVYTKTIFDTRLSMVYVSERVWVCIAWSTRRWRSTFVCVSVRIHKHVDMAPLFVLLCHSYVKCLYVRTLSSSHSH